MESQVNSHIFRITIILSFKIYARFVSAHRYCHNSQILYYLMNQINNVREDCIVTFPVFRRQSEEERKWVTVSIVFIYKVPSSGENLYCHCHHHHQHSGQIDCCMIVDVCSISLYRNKC